MIQPIIHTFQSFTHVRISVKGCESVHCAYAYYYSLILVIVRESIYNYSVNHSLLSEFHLRYNGVKVDSICHKHGGTNKMVIQEIGMSLVIPLELAGFMIHFKQRLPTIEEFSSLEQYCLTQGHTPWNRS
jgi:hypothetical protein